MERVEWHDLAMHVTSLPYQNINLLEVIPPIHGCYTHGVNQGENWSSAKFASKHPLILGVKFPYLHCLLQYDA